MYPSIKQTDYYPVFTRISCFLATKPPARCHFKTQVQIFHYSELGDS